MTRISGGGANIHTETTGNSEEWLVLLHEIGCALQSWSAAAPAPAKRFCVLRYDQRGAGSSDEIEREFSIETQVDDLRAVAERIFGAHYTVIDSGHIMPVQAPREMLAAINAFDAKIARHP